MNRKLCSVLLSLSMLLSILCLTSCSKKPAREALRVLAEDEWYDNSVIDIDDRYSAEECDSIYCEYLMFEDGKHYVWANGIDYDYNSICFVDIYDVYGEYIESYDVGSMLSADDQFMGYCCAEGKLYVDIISHSLDGAEAQCITFDLNTGETSIDRINTEYGLELNNYELVITDSFVIDGCHIRALASCWGESYIRYVEFEYADGSTKSFSMEDNPNEKLAELYQVIQVGDRNVVVGRVYNVGQRLYNLDIDNGRCEQIDGEFDWINDNGIELYYCATGDDNKVITYTRDIVDLAAHEIVGKFDYSSSYINLNYTDFLAPVYVDDNRVICAGDLSSIQCGSGKSVFRIAVFDKADSNPNAGKTLITALNPIGISADVIADYNLNSDEYFVKCIFSSVEDYVATQPDGLYFDDTAAWTRYYLEAEEAMARQLKNDIENGVGPDIIFSYNSNLIELGSGECLADLSSKINDAGILGSGEYFDNVFEDLKVGNKYYWIPMSIGLEGNLVLTEYLEADQYGLNYEEYEYLYDECYNTRQKTYDKFNDFVNAIVYQYDLFDGDGTIDFNNDAFRVTAEYYHDYVFNYLRNQFPSDEYSAPMGVGNYTFTWHLKTLGRFRLIGFPSFDGRGASFYTNTMAITKNSPVEDEAWQILQLILAPENQLNCMSEVFDNDYSDSIPVNISAFENRATTELETFNQNIAENCGYYGLDDSMKALYGFDTPLEPTVIEEFKQMVSHAGAPRYYVESEIKMTLYEEIQAYFAGDRTVEELIPIINDRCSTIRSERG